MGIIRSFALSVTALVAACLLMLITVFVTGLSLDVPGVVDISSTVTGPPSAEMTIGPGMLVVALVLTALIEVPGRLRARRTLPRC